MKLRVFYGLVRIYFWWDMQSFSHCSILTPVLRFIKIHPDISFESRHHWQLIKLPISGMGSLSKVNH
ncbi:hypothetical protein OO18_19890 [Raoultella ornithinolytica]|nr:hypothetical protein OO18_19890 [Raoultella ornithinolytica]PQH21388.1 hypothetical protein CWD63_21630 [Raoultella ornithinolytica]